MTTFKMRLVCVFGIVNAVACVPALREEQVRSAPRPADTAKAETLHERQDAAPEIVASVSGNAVDVEVRQRVECRDVTRTQSVVDVEATRSIAPYAQWINAGGAALLGGAGAIAAFGPCKSRQTDPATGVPYDLPCNPSDASTQTTLGFILLGTAAIPIAAFIYNMVRTHDDHTIEPSAPLADSGSWTTCSTKPLEAQEITLEIGGKTLSGSTDANGHVAFDVAAARPTFASADKPVAVVRGGGSQEVTVDLSSLPDMNVAGRRKAFEVAIKEAAFRQERRVQRETLQQTIAAGLRSALAVSVHVINNDYDVCTNNIGARIACTSDFVWKHETESSRAFTANVSNGGPTQLSHCQLSYDPATFSLGPSASRQVRVVDVQRPIDEGDVVLDCEVSWGDAARVAQKSEPELRSLFAPLTEREPNLRDTWLVQARAGNRGVSVEWASGERAAPHTASPVSGSASSDPSSGDDVLDAIRSESFLPMLPNGTDLYRMIRFSIALPDYANVEPAIYKYRTQLEDNRRGILEAIDLVRKCAGGKAIALLPPMNINTDIDGLTLFFDRDYKLTRQALINLQRATSLVNNSIEILGSLGDHGVFAKEDLASQSALAHEATGWMEHAVSRIEDVLTNAARR